MRDTAGCVNLPAMKNRLPLAVLTFALVVGIADLHGWGRGYLGILALTWWFFGFAELPPLWQKTVIGAFLIVSVWASFIALTQIEYSPRPQGPFASAVFLGDFAALAILLAFYVRPRFEHKIWIDMAIAGNAAGLALSQSRGAMMAAALGIIVAFYRSRPHLMLALGCAAAVTVTIICLERNPFEDARLNIWAVGYDVFSHHPILGWGQNSINVIGIRGFYNIGLEWAINAGAIGLTTAGWMIVEAVLAARGNRIVLGFIVAWLAQGMLMFSTPETGILLYTMLALVVSEHRNVARVAEHGHDHHPFLDGGVGA